MAAVGRMARPLGAEIEQPAVIVAKLGEGEATPVPDVRIVHAELMPVITQRERPRQIIWQGLEPAEMLRPLSPGEIQCDTRSPALVEKARRALWETRGLDRIVEVLAKREDLRIRPVACHRW